LRSIMVIDAVKHRHKYGCAEISGVSAECQQKLLDNSRKGEDTCTNDHHIVLLQL
jgi:hypothetical protein